MRVDLLSAVLVMAVLRLVQVPLLLYVGRVHRAYQPAREWGMASLLEGLGYFLVTFQSGGPSVPAIVFGNGGLIAGEILFNVASARSAGAQPRLWPAVWILLCSLSALSYFAFVQPSLQARILTYTAALLPYRCYAIVQCLAYPGGRLHQTLRLLAGVMSFDVVVNLVRAAHSGEMHSVLEQTPAQLLYAFNLVTYVLSSTGLVVLLAGQRLQEELAAARDAAEVANRAKSTFLRTMSHELRTPLNGILGFAQILLADGTLSDSQREGVATVQRSGLHLLTLINDILDLAKVESGKLDMTPEIFEPLPLLQSLVDLLAVRARAKGLALHFDASDLPAQVVGDSRRLRQVLLNLLGNAIKFTDRGLVRLTVTRGLRFRVQDTGPGISSSDMERLFQPFSQFGPVEKQAEGTGLGLSISRRLVELMGGQLHAESKPGQGTSFSFELALPEVETAAPPAQPKPRPGNQGRGRRILVVDDLAENRAICRGLLAPLGFEIDQAADGPSALLRVEASPPDLILLDLNMPGMNGLEVMHRLRPGCRIPVIMVTASAFAEDRQRARQAGCEGFLSKPVERESLLDEVERLLRLEPAAIWEALGEAAEIGDVAVINRLIEELSREDSELAGELRRLAHQFDFDGLLARVEKGKVC